MKILALLLLCATQAFAQSYPSKPVRLVVGFAPGGAADFVARAFQEPLGRALGQPIVVENRPGAGGTIGTDVVAKAAPDGHTLLMATAAHTITAATYERLPFDARADFAPVTRLVATPLLLVVHPSVPAATVPDLVARARAEPGKISFASSGLGTSHQMASEFLKATAGIDIVHVPYRGSAPALVDLLAGRVHLIFDNIPTALAVARQGKVRPLAVTTAQRSPVVPEIPTMSEFLPGFDMTSWTCACGPAAVPRAIVAQMSEFTRKALESPDLIRSFRDNGAEPFVTTPEEITAYRAAEQARLAPLIRASGARVE
jgi:tripartite-type tricarboxylate transporter receptor subunit TctC